MDYKLFAELRKEQEARIKQEQRGEVITKLLSEANKQSEKTNAEEAPGQRDRAHALHSVQSA